MANQHDEQNQAPENKATKKTKTHDKKNNRVSIVALILALTSLVVAALGFQTNRLLHQKLAHQRALLKNQTQEFKTLYLNNKDQIEQTFQQVSQAQNTLNNQVVLLDKKMDTEITQGTYQNQDWLCLKVRYYLELAQINHLWSQDSNTTIALMKEADRLLANIHSLKISEIRQALAHELATLKAMPNLDYAGILSSLNAAETSLNQLPLQKVVSQQEGMVLAPPSTEPSGWRLHLKNSLDLLKKLVVVRRDDEGIKPLMSSEFLSLTRARIQFSLQEAQWAVLNNNAKVYDLALTQATTQLKDTFGTTTETQALIDELTRLHELSLNQDKPSIAQSLTLLNQFISHQEVMPKNPVDGTGAHES